MTFIQRFFTRILPRAWAESMRAESEQWMVQCPCGFERSVWEMGGIRWKAVGNPRRRGGCPQCGQVTWHTLQKRE
ncbi:MAG: hypothetical protein KF893_27240 [Caldilineaceae bacterium]|nr:hypothetical protein [Caldilineaceae bacterium]